MTCSWCEAELGKLWWQRVPGAGNLCVPCHQIWLAKRAIAARGTKKLRCTD